MTDRSVVLRLMANVSDLQAKMKAAEKAVRDVGDQTDATAKKSQDSLGKITQHARDNEQAWTDTGKAVLGIGAVAAVGVGAAVRQFANFDAAMSAVQASTLASAGEMDRLRETALKAGADTAFSAEQAAGGIEELAKAGVSTADIVGGGLSGALDLAAAGGLGVSEAAEIAASTLVQFNLSGDRATDVADALAAGAGKAQGSVQDLGLALGYAGVPAAALGISVEETTGTLALFASTGITGEKAGTALRAMLVSLQNPSEKAKGLMADLGIEVFDAQGKFIGMEGTAGVLQDRLAGLTDEQRGSALATIFGNESLGAATTLYNGGAAAVDEWTAAVSESGYAAEVASTRLDNLRGDAEALGGSLETALIGLGESGNGPLRDLTQDATTMVNAFSEAPPVFQQVAIGAGVTTAAVGLLGGAALLAVPKFVAANAALAAMGPAGAKAAAGLSAASKSLAALSGPLILLTAGGAVAVDYWLDNKQAIEAYTDSLDEATGAVTDLSREQARRLLIDSGARDAAADLGLSLDLVTEAAIGNKNAIAEVDAVLAEHNTKVGEGTGLYGAWLRFADATTITMDSQGEAAGVVARQLGIQNDRVREARDVWAGERDVVNKAATEHYELSGGIDAVNDGLAGLPGAADSAATSIALIGDTSGMTQEQVDAAVSALEEWQQQLETVASGFVEPLAVYQGLLAEKNEAEQEAAQATADATEDATDSWEDYAGDVTVSLDELAAELEAQVEAQENWRANLVTVTERGGIEVGQLLAAMGAEGADITAAMATATEEDFDRMAAAMIADAQFGGEGAAAALDTEMQVMAAVGAAGAKATVKGIADELGLGTDQVRGIARSYGVQLAEGINPLLASLGKEGVRPFLPGGGGATEWRPFADGGFEDHTAQIAPAGAWRVWAEPETGGEAYIPLAPAKRERSLSIWRETGKRLGVDASFESYAAGGFSSVGDVPGIPSVAPYRAPISTAANATTQKAYDEVRAFIEANSFMGVALPAGGAKDLVGIGRLLQSLGARVSEHPAFGGVNGRHSPTSLHYLGRAIDVNYGPGGANATENSFMRQVIPQLRELASFRQLYYREIGGRTDHDDHLHLGMAKGGILNPHVRDQGGPLLPGYTYNGTGGTEDTFVMPPGLLHDFSTSAPGAGGGSRVEVSIPVTVTADAPLAEHYARRVADQAVARLEDAIAANGLAAIANGAHG